MSTPCIILASLPSFCQKLPKLWKFDEVLTKSILHSFLRHGVYIRTHPFCNHQGTKEINVCTQVLPISMYFDDYRERELEMHKKTINMSCIHRTIRIVCQYSFISRER